MEVWKDIVGYENYQVSNLGRIRRLDSYIHTEITGVERRFLKGRVLKPYKNNSGYMTVQLSKDGKRKKFLVHRLVLQTFVPNPDNLPECNHIDECKTNNRVENLEWCSHQHNMNWKDVIKRKVVPKLRKTEEEKEIKRKIYIETHREMIKKRQHLWYLKKRRLKGRNLKEVLQYDIDGNLINSFKSAEEAKRITGISHISCVCNGNRSSAGGYLWRWQMREKK